MAEWDLGAMVRSYNSSTNDQTASFTPQIHSFAPTFPRNNIPNNNFPNTTPNYSITQPDFAAPAGLTIRPMQHPAAVFSLPPLQQLSLAAWPLKAPGSNVPDPHPGNTVLQYTSPRRVMGVTAPAVPIPRLKRVVRNPLKTVCTVSEENLEANMWRWRKHGQKLIKGSPFPRCYYRCSSSKGCPARKHVERSRMNPELFVVTFSGKHNHCRPNGIRNPLAGKNRSKSLIYQPPPLDGPPSLPPATFVCPPMPKSIEYLDSMDSRTRFAYDDLLFPEIKISDDIFGDMI